MSLTTLLTEPVSVIPRTYAATDAYGNPVATDGTTRDYMGRLEETETEEILVGKDKIISTWRLFLGPAAEIDAGCAVTGRGRLFEVVGDPKEEHSPAGLHHIEARLREVRG